MSWNEERVQHMLDALRRNDPACKRAELRMSLVAGSKTMTQEWLFKQFLWGMEHNTVATTLQFSSRGMDEERMHALAELCSKKPALNRLHLDLWYEEPAKCLAAFFSRLPPSIDYISFHMNNWRPYYESEDFEPVENFFATATKLSIVDFSEPCGNCQFNAAVLRGLSRNPTTQSIVCTDTLMDQRPLQCFANIEESSLRLVTAIEKIPRCRRFCPAFKMGIVSSFVCLGAPVFVHGLGEPNNCAGVEWRKVGVDDEQTLAQSERAFRIFLERLASNEQQHLHAMWLDEECCGAAFGSSLAQCISNMPRLLNVYKVSKSGRLEGVEAIDMSQWEAKDKLHVLKCLEFHKVMDTSLMKCYDQRDDFSKPALLLRANLPSALWPNILQRALRPDECWQTSRPTASLSAVYCLLREGNSQIIPRLFHITDSAQQCQPSQHLFQLA